MMATRQEGSQEARLVEKKKTPETEISFPLFDLPRHLVPFIAGKMSFTAQFCFKIAVRKGLPAGGSSNQQQLPWIMLFPEDWLHKFPYGRGEYKLCDPLSRRTYTVEAAADVPRFIRSTKSTPPYHDTAEICASNHGWLLVGKKMDVAPYSSFFFFFSPFINGTPLTLPSLNCPYRVATFSSPPTSGEDCVVFVISRDLHEGMRLHTCRYGDTQWRSVQCFDDELTRYPRSPIWHDGKFYCVFENGVLMAYSVAEQSWFQLSESAGPCSGGCMYLLKSDDGQLFTVAWDHNGKNQGLYRVFRYDFSLMTWVEQTSDLENRALFVGGTCNYSLLVEKKGTTSNGIYHHVGNCPGSAKKSTGFYSLNTKNHYDTTEVYGWIAEDERLYRAWIEPTPPPR